MRTITDTIHRMKEIKYRKATSMDVSAIAELHAESWRTNYRGEYSDQYLDRDVFEDRDRTWKERFRKEHADQYVVVAELEGQVVGFACVYGGEDARWGSFLDNIHVLSGQQSRGIGAGLMQRVFQWCKKNYPSDGLYLWVLNSNKRGQKFYSSLGAVDRGGEFSEPAGGGEIHGRRYVWIEVPNSI